MSGPARAGEGVVAREPFFFLSHAERTSIATHHATLLTAHRPAHSATAAAARAAAATRAAALVAAAFADGEHAAVTTAAVAAAAIATVSVVSATVSDKAQSEPEPEKRDGDGAASAAGNGQPKGQHSSARVPPRVPDGSPGLPHALVHKLALKQSISAKQGQKWWAGSLGWSICMADLGENGPRGTRAGGRLRPSCWARSTHLCERTRAAKRRDQPLRPLAAAARLPLYTTTGWW